MLIFSYLFLFSFFKTLLKFLFLKFSLNSIFSSPSNGVHNFFPHFDTYYKFINTLKVYKFV